MNRQEAIHIIKNNWPNGRHMLSEALEFLIPELKESEDERIRRELVAYLDVQDAISNRKDQDFKSWIAWLEKQCTKEPKKTSIWKHWKDGIAGNGASKLIYLIKDGNDYSLSSVLGRECDYVLLSDLDKLMLEENQGEQKPTEWSEEDEKIKYEIEVILANTDLSKLKLNYTFFNMISWLKSLKERYTWKPSDEQIAALEASYSVLKIHDTWCEDEHLPVLMSLINDLKKL